MKVSDMKKKTHFKMSEVGRHPVLQPEQMDGKLTYFKQRKNDYPLASLLPLVEVDKEKVVWDVEKSMRGGMTPAVSRGSESPIHGGFGRGQIEWEPAEFREKCILDELDLAGLRKIGTREDLEDANSVMDRKFGALQVRLQNRLEWMRRQAIFDSEVTAKMPSGQEMVVPYAHPAYLERTLTGGDTWDDASTSNPVANLQEWVHDMIDVTGFAPSRVIFGHDVLYNAMQNDLFADMASNTGNGRSVEEVRQYLIHMTGVPEIETMSHKIQFQTEITAAAANGTNTLVLRNVDSLEVGDTIIVKSPKDLNSEKFEVDTISGNTVTTVDPVDRADGFVPGSPLVYSKFVVPKDRILITGSMDGNLSTENTEDPGGLDMTNALGDVCSTRSYYEDLVGSTGVFQKTIDNTDQDPPSWERVLGIRALPRINYPEAFFWAKVL